MKASDNKFPKLLLNVGSAPAAPTGSTVALYVEDDKLKMRDSEGVDTVINPDAEAPSSELLVTTKTTEGDLVSADGNFIRVNFAAPGTITLPADSTFNFPIGYNVLLYRVGEQVTVAAGAGAALETIASPVLSTQYSAARAVKVAANTWAVVFSGGIADGGEEPELGFTRFLLQGDNASVIYDDTGLTWGLSSSAQPTRNTTDYEAGSGAIQFNGVFGGMYHDPITEDTASRFLIAENEDFCFEFDLNPTNLVDSFILLSNELVIRLTDTGGSVFEVSASLPGPVNLISNVGLIAGNFVHVALARNAGTLRLYILGAERDSIAHSAALDLGGTAINIGGIADPDGLPGEGLTGILDRIRLSIGTSRYTGEEFTPPVGPFVVD